MLNDVLCIYLYINKRFILEILEVLVVEMLEFVVDFMFDFQYCGVLFCLDDYGFEYMFFKILQDWYFEFVKFDGSYMQWIYESQEKCIFVGIVVLMLQCFGIYSVVMKIEF